MGQAVDDEATTETAAEPGTASRRQVIGRAIGAAGVVAVGGVGYGVARATEPGGSPSPPASSASDIVPFYGANQAGIATPAQDRLAFAAFDVTSGSAQAFQVMLGTWAAAAAQMTKGLPVGAVDNNPQSPPIDTGEADGLSAAGLTITVGFGPSLFDHRFGLAGKRPAALADLPTLPGDGSLQPARSGGDLCVQACADDPTVAFHVIRNFARLARGTAVIRWSQLGFGRTSSTSDSQQTERNLMGFKDGTRNIKAEAADDLRDHVWVGSETDQAWMTGGSYLVARRIRMLIESWDTDYLSDQENVFGRFKTSGAPLTGKSEFDTPDLAAKHTDGTPVIPLNAHIRLAGPETNNNQKILRRGYSYTDGIDSATGLLDAGLFFLAYQKDPRRQFVPIQTRLGHQDNLNEYIRHTGSALFAVPPGVSAAGDWWGKSLFA
ncbi:Dyp-type peroxidase family [Catenulispora acidiphila DSM 44928]|uniref:Deferrochelatase n=1 Tax=Catenulispora acidiphila (strain DSM 44928 / JCM 14897 / NBRC 102108 / NRRL B-24433 / ID139908) TaxID=479433 RepID=C7QEL8_CATAD|nr:iron uptake transporter deferrochelatase/peroxidase subunit [Catenulispora acidiphila]ACU72788.1 Dyp-type peroxidase family [Catenulispora acidiphila DSM 44928]